MKIPAYASNPISPGAHVRARLRAENLRVTATTPTATSAVATIDVAAAAAAAAMVATDPAHLLDVTRSLLRKPSMAARLVRPLPVTTLR